MKPQDARIIAQDVLDRQGAATVAGDIEATLGWGDLPLTLESLEGSLVAEDEAQLRTICETFIERLKVTHVEHMVRRCLSAEFKDPDTIWATYETRYVQKGNLLVEDPYVGFVILRRRPERWKISMMQFAVAGETPMSAVLGPATRDKDSD